MVIVITFECTVHDICRLTVYSEKNVPIFGPPLPCPPVFHNHQEFRDFLLIKCKCCVVSCVRLAVKY